MEERLTLEELQKRWLSVSGMLSDADPKNNAPEGALLAAMQGLASLVGGLIVYLAEPEPKNIEHVITIRLTDPDFLAEHFKAAAIFGEASAVTPTRRRYTYREPESPKPPLGLMPRWRWIEIRAEELIDAIVRNLKSPDKTTVVDGWLTELNGIWYELAELRATTKAEPVNEAAIAPEKKSTEPTDEAIRRIFQNIWTRHAGAPGYERSEWEELRQLLFRRYGLEL